MTHTNTAVTPSPSAPAATDESLPTETRLPAAVEAHISMPPALVEAVQEDPELLTQLTRGQLAVVQDRMVKRVLGDPDATVSQLATVHDALSRNAKLKPDAGVAAGAGAQVIINFVVGGKKEPVVIEGQATDVTPG